MLGPKRHLLLVFYFIILYFIVSYLYLILNEHKHLKPKSQVVQTFNLFITWLHTLCSLYYFIVPMEQKLSILSFYYTVETKTRNVYCQIKSQRMKPSTSKYTDCIRCDYWPGTKPDSRRHTTHLIT